HFAFAKFNITFLNLEILKE
ncbi:hypothetical protein CEXT_462841, partial [Caerostris extrusa]